MAAFTGNLPPTPNIDARCVSIATIKPLLVNRHFLNHLWNTYTLLLSPLFWIQASVLYYTGVLHLLNNSSISWTYV